MARAERMRELRAERKALGLCGYCGAATARLKRNGELSSYCDHCWTRHCAYMNKRQKHDKEIRDYFKENV